MPILGQIALYFCVGLIVIALIAYGVSMRSMDPRTLATGRRATIGIFAMFSVAVASLWWSILADDFSVVYVQEYSARDLSAFYKVTDLWAGNPGSLLFWGWVLSGYTMVVANGRALRGRRMAAFVPPFLLLNLLFFASMTAFVVSPFVTATPTADGAGLNPLLQDPFMAIHPVALYLGYIGMAVPFAFAAGALASGELDDFWIRASRRWALIGWMFLSCGLLLGAAWAYHVLGWGGYWGWDPVENAALLPWLTGTAFLHSVMIQERKEMLKVWNVLLIVVTYLLTLFGDYTVRSGVINSVHAFAQSAVGVDFLIFLVTMTVLGLGLFFWRLPRLHSKSGVERYASKEASFLANNILFVAIAFAVFWGTIYPLVSKALTGISATVGPPFYNHATAPFFAALLVLLGVCPFIAWQKSSWARIGRRVWPSAAVGFGVTLVLWAMGLQKPLALVAFGVAAYVLATHLIELVRGGMARRRRLQEPVLTAFGRLYIRNRRTYGGYWVHVGVALIAVGVIGSMAYAQKMEGVSLQLGQSVQIGSYTVRYTDLSDRTVGQNAYEVYAHLEVERDGHSITAIEPSKRFFHNNPLQPQTQVGLHSTLSQDLYVVLNSWAPDGSINLNLFINPLVMWIWIGGVVLVAGTLLAAWPGRYAEAIPRYQEETLPWQHEAVSNW